MTDRIVSFGIVSAAIIGLVAAGLFLFGQPLLAKAGLTTFAAPCNTATASSTNSTFAVYVEESMDGQDWYPIPLMQAASTTNIFDLSVRAYSTFKFASSTIGGGATVLNGIGANGTNNRNHYELDIPVRMKQVRAYVTLPQPATWGIGLTSTSTYNGAV